MNVLEQRYMERMPVLLNDLLKELRELRTEVEDLRKELQKNGCGD